MRRQPRAQVGAVSGRPSSPLPSQQPSYLEPVEANFAPNGTFDSGVIRCLDDQLLAAEEEKPERIKTYLRIRPHLKKQEGEALAVVVKDPQTVVVVPPSTAKGKAEKVEFSFTKVLDSSSTQEQVFDEAVSPVLEYFYKGDNCMIFSYGATNSGKTFTMRGSAHQYGIIPRTLYQIFNIYQDSIYKKGDIQPFRHESTRVLSQVEVTKMSVKKKLLMRSISESSEMKQRAAVYASNRTYTQQSSSHCATLQLVGANEDHVVPGFGNHGDVSLVAHNVVSLWISFVELYNERCYDLLSTDKRKEIKIVQDKGGYSYFKDITELPVFSEDEAYALYVSGYKKLEMGSTGANEASSRSHCFFTIRVVDLGNCESRVFPQHVHKITFCDLAGCERVSQTENSGFQLRESANINQSLLSLLKVIRMIRSCQAKRQSSSFLERIPIRDSKLTRIFHGYFSTAAHVTMIVNVNPIAKMADSSLHTLKNSAIASSIVACKPKPVQGVLKCINYRNRRSAFINSGLDLEDLPEEDEEAELEETDIKAGVSTQISPLKEHNFSSSSPREISTSKIMAEKDPFEDKENSKDAYFLQTYEALYNEWQWQQERIKQLESENHRLVKKVESIAAETKAVLLMEFQKEYHALYEKMKK